MEKITITINGEIKEMTPIKARFWKEIMKFDEEKKDFLKSDAIEKYCEIIALAFGVTTDEVLDNLELQDVLPKYFEVYKAVVEMLSAKTGKKNKEAEVEAQA